MAAQQLNGALAAAAAAQSPTAAAANFAQHAAFAAVNQPQTPTADHQHVYGLAAQYSRE